MLSGIAFFFIFLYQSPKHQAFAFGFGPLAGFRPLIYDRKLLPRPSTIRAMIIFVLVFG